MIICVDDKSIYVSFSIKVKIVSDGRNDTCRKNLTVLSLVKEKENQDYNMGSSYLLQDAPDRRYLSF